MNSYDYDYDYGTTLYSTSTQLDNATAAALGMVVTVFLLFYFIVAVLCVVSVWRLFMKAGKPGWAAIVPVYNQIVMLQVAGRPVWWVLLMMFVPIFQVWVAIVAAIDFAKSYGKSTGFGVLVALLPFIGLPLLAFGKDTHYVGPVAEGLDTFTPAPDRTPAATPTVPPAPAA